RPTAAGFDTRATFLWQRAVFRIHQEHGAGRRIDYRQAAAVGHAPAAASHGRRFRRTHPAQGQDHHFRWSPENGEGVYQGMPRRKMHHERDGGARAGLLDRELEWLSVSGDAIQRKTVLLPDAHGSVT